GGPGLPGLAGAGPTAGNVISGNGVGVDIAGSGTMWNIVVGNLIGTNLAGTAALPNLVAGVEINGGASRNVIGGPRPDGPSPGIPGAPSQVISGNGHNGVTI